MDRSGRQACYDELHRAQEATLSARLSMARVTSMLRESRHFDLAQACAEEATVLQHSLAALGSYVVPEQA